MANWPATNYFISHDPKSPIAIDLNVIGSLLAEDDWEEFPKFSARMADLMEQAE